MSEINGPANRNPEFLHTHIKNAAAHPSNRIQEGETPSEPAHYKQYYEIIPQARKKSRPGQERLRMELVMSPSGCGRKDSPHRGEEWLVKRSRDFHSSFDRLLSSRDRPIPSKGGAIGVLDCVWKSGDEIDYPLILENTELMGPNPMPGKIALRMTPLPVAATFCRLLR